MGSAWSGRSGRWRGPRGIEQHERAVSARAPQGLLQPRLLRAVGALDLGVFPVLGSDSPGREGSAGLSSGVAEGEGTGGRGP